MTKVERIRSILLPIIAVLLIAEIAILPLVIGKTYSGRSVASEHFLTYNDYEFKWDENTDVNKEGVAELHIFDTSYDNVNSSNKDKVIAPGTEGGTVIRLKNDTTRTVAYQAVIYAKKTVDNLEITTNIPGKYSDSPDVIHNLPEGVNPEDVLETATGSLSSMKLQDFDINWVWDFTEGEEGDVIDTSIGNEDSKNTVIGCYVVIQDEGEVVVPQTGDNSTMELYAALMIISLCVLILLISSRRRERKSNA